MVVISLYTISHDITLATTLYKGKSKGKKIS